MGRLGAGVIMLGWMGGAVDSMPCVVGARGARGRRIRFEFLVGPSYWCFCGDGIGLRGVAEKGYNCKGCYQPGDYVLIWVGLGIIDYREGIWCGLRTRG